MLILSIFVVFALLLGSELWWRKKRPHSELSRKFVHITVGSFAAVWPWFLSRDQMLLLSAAFILAVSISRYLNLFQAIHAVERPTWGEVCFALAVGLLAWFVNDRLIYMVALLHMSLADGFAALIGVRFGKNNSYKILHHTKSLAGTLTFFVVSLGILTGYALAGQPSGLQPLDIIALSVLAAALENVAVFGLDNLAIPLLVAVVLQQLG